MTAIIAAVVIGALVGYAIGRIQKFSAHVEHDFQAWRDRVTGAALLPKPVEL
jgi:membrane protein DedA with SNARE-associated domain